MNLALGRKGSYSVQVMMHLARHDRGRRRKTREIADEVDVPSAYLPHILAALVRRGLLTAVAGPSGGYALASPPAKITLLHVIEAAEGPLLERECLLSGETCDPVAPCELHGLWTQAQDVLATELSRTTLADLAQA